MVGMSHDSLSMMKIDLPGLRRSLALPNDRVERSAPRLLGKAGVVDNPQVGGDPILYSCGGQFAGRNHVCSSIAAILSVAARSSPFAWQVKSMGWFRRTVRGQDAGAGGGPHARRRLRWIAIAVCVIAAMTFLGPRTWTYWHIQSAQRQLELGNSQAAVDQLLRVVAFSPGSAAAQYRLAVAQRRAGHLDQVSEPLRMAQKLGWDKDDVERQSLLSLVQNGEIDKVEPRLKVIMGRGASDEAAAEIYEALSIGYLKTYRLKEAWDCLGAWGQWQPRAIFPKFWRADICRRIENPTIEEKEYREILAIDPTQTESRSRLAEVLRSSNRVEEAAREYEMCQRQQANRPDVLIGLVECYRRLGNPAEAIRLLEIASALDLPPDQRAAALVHQGEIAADNGKWAEAVKSLERAAELAPSEHATLFALSQAYGGAGEKEKAAQALERSKVVRAKQLRVDDIARSLVVHPASADLRYEAGTIFMELGMEKEGAAWLEAALKMQPDHKQAREALDKYLGPNSAAGQ